MLIGQPVARVGGFGVGFLGLRIPLIDFLGPVVQEGARLSLERADDLEACLDLLLVEDGLERVAAVALGADVAVDAGDGLRRVLAGERLLLAFVGDADRPAADAAARGAAGAAGGAHHHGRRSAPVAAAGQVAAGHFACARAGLALLVGADAARRGPTCSARASDGHHAAVAHAVASADAQAAAPVVGPVLNVALRERGGAQAVGSVLHRRVLSAI